MMKKKFAPLLLIITIIYSCSPALQVDYSNISVPEEGGINFTQYSRDEEEVVYPAIFIDEITENLRWYAAPLIALSPDGVKLAYIAKSNDFFNLNIKKVSGGRAIVQRTFNRNINDMDFSPDGKWIAFTELKGTDQNIYIINADEGSAVQQITSSNYSELGPSYAPDGKSLYYSKQEGSRFYIWNVNLDSSLKTQYSEGFTPALTPDGENLIVTRNGKDGSRGEIWMINIKKGTETLILSDPERGFSSPQISPKGDVLLCVGTTEKGVTRPQNLDLYTIKLDGTGLKQLTFHGGHDVSPQWSPDGNSIFFLAQRGNIEGKYNIWKMNFNN